MTEDVYDYLWNHLDEFLPRYPEDDDDVAEIRRIVNARLDALEDFSAPEPTRPCPSCRAPLSATETHWTLGHSPGGYMCPIGRNDVGP